MNDPKPQEDRCASCGVKIKKGDVLCDKCLKEWWEKEGK